MGTSLSDIDIIDQAVNLNVRKAAPRPAAVYGCIAGVSASLSRVGIPKDRKNLQQNYPFRGIDQVMNALAPALSAHGLVILPRVKSRTETERQTKSGGVLFSVVVCVDFDFVAVADGSTYTVTMYGEAMDSADKATNKALSAAYKYAAFQAFCIPVEGHDDADATTPEPVVARPPTTLSTGTPAAASVETPPARVVETSGISLSGAYSATQYGEELPDDGRLYIARVDITPTRNANVQRGLVTFSDGRQASTIKSKLIALCEQFAQDMVPISIETEDSKFGMNLLGVYALQERGAGESTDDGSPF